MISKSNSECCQFISVISYGDIRLNTFNFDIFCFLHFNCNQVRVENIKTPEDHIPAVLERVKRDYITRTYGVDNWADHEEFLEKVAQRSGRLLKVSKLKSSDSSLIF